MAGKVKVLVSNKRFSEEHIKRIRGISERIEVVRANDNESRIKEIEDTEVLIGGLNEDMFSVAKCLKWVQLTGAGANRLLFPKFVDSQVVLTNASGVHRIPISELIMALVLGLTKRLQIFMRSQLRARWERDVLPEIHGKTIGLLGLGSIGMETAWLAKAFDMRVLALKRRTIRRPSYVDSILGVEDLDYLLRESDYIVNTLPLTKETKHFIGERELRLMKPSAYIINVGRGGTIDNEALLKALKEGWISGAGLDVFEKEPLPSESEFWKLENVIITPHIAGGTPHYEDRLLDIFLENLKRYLEGRPLINVVDKKAGY